jgi:hypothetical protein
MVIDGVFGLLRRRGGVHARAQGLFDGRAAAPVVAGGSPAGWLFSERQQFVVFPFYLSTLGRRAAGERDIPRTEDMTVTQGFGSGRSGFRTRSTRRGGSRIGFLLDIMSSVGRLREGEGDVMAARASRVLGCCWRWSFEIARQKARAAKPGGAERFTVTW